MNVTVITVCYNVASMLESTIKSVLGQTYSEIEYIIIDGGSTDGTVDIIKRYSDRIAYWVSEPDKGIYNAMNKGLSHANGDWVCFMNAGDSFVDSNVISDIFSKNNISSQIKIIGGHTNLIYPDKIELLKASGADFIPYGIPFCHQSCFVRINEEGYKWKFNEEYRYAADYKLMYDTFFSFGATAIMILDMVVANYKMEDSFSFADTRKPQKEYLIIQSRHINLVWIKNLIKYILKR